MAFVQHKNGASGNSNSVALAFDSNVTAGNSLIIGVAIEDAGASVAITSISGNSNTYTLVEGPRRGGSQNGTLWLYVVKSATSGATTVTVNFDATGYPKISMQEYSGRDTTNTINDSNAAQGTSGVPDAGALTTSAECDVFAMCQTGAGTPSEGTGYTLDDTQGPYWYGASQHKVAVAAGSVSVAFGGPSGGDWVSVAAGLAKAGGGGSTAHIPAYLQMLRSNQ